MVGTPDGDDFVLNGEKRFVADPEAASLLIVSFRTGDSPGDVGLAVIEVSDAGVEGKSYPIMDETKRLG